MAKWESVTGLFPIGRLPNTQLVGVKRGNTYYARAYTVPSNPRTDRQRVVRAANMVIGNALYRMSKDPEPREWKRTLRAVTGIDDIRRAWIALVANAYDADSQTFNFPAAFRPVEKGGVYIGGGPKTMKVVSRDLGSEVVVYLAISRGVVNEGQIYRPVDVPLPQRVHDDAEDWSVFSECSGLDGSRAIDALIVEGNANLGYWYSIFYIEATDVQQTVWTPNGVQTVKEVHFGYVANVAPELRILTHFGPAGVTMQDWASTQSEIYLPFAAPRTLTPQPETYPYHVYKVQANIIDGRTPQACGG